MLYDPDNALSRDDQSTCEAEAILSAQLAKLSVASPSGSLADKQRFVHFLADKHLRLPHLVVRFGTQIIQNAAGKLGNAGQWTEGAGHDQACASDWSLEFLAHD